MTHLLHRILGIFILFGIFTASYAQQEAVLAVTGFLKEEWTRKNLPLQDITNQVIQDQYTDAKTGITYVYIQQMIGDIPIDHAIANFAIKNGKIEIANYNNLIHNVHSKITSINPIEASDATISSLTHLSGKNYLRAKPLVTQKINSNHIIFSKTNETLENISTKLVYYSTAQDALILTWKVEVHDLSGNYWEVYVHGQNGNIIEKKNKTLACTFGHNHGYTATKPLLPFTNMVPQYRVYPVPLAAPNDGASSLVTELSDKTASPLGWHDDGTAQFKITKGNNVHAFSDPDSNLTSSGDEPMGGDNLLFDYNYNESGTINQNKNAAIVNLFYTNNFMHDFAFNYGFTEPAGNFQTKNITNTGRGSDAIIALGQYGYNNSRIRNNATFLTPSDGTRGIMRMYVFNQSGEKLLKITQPTSLAQEFATGTAEFGPQVSTIPISGRIAIVNDGTTTPTLGCKTFTNAADIKDKIAIIDRGDCFFVQKACFAQSAGAIAVIIVNHENSPNNMASAASPPCTVTIPVISVSSSDGAIIKRNASTIVLTLQRPNTNVALERDASFDNQIISHEYTHGISNRLTGGPSNSSCLSNNEQMGEGWSDFISLVLSVKPGDLATRSIGVGTYSLQQQVSERGVRRFPYSTNLNVNALTYEDIFTVDDPHPVGEVWASMLWDLYWNMVSVYGWDQDVFKGNGGNNKAVRLVFEGMRLQPCRPGFINGRDAILNADRLLFNGENQCIIWETFAKRGLGFSSKQGSNNIIGDGTESYDVPPTCIPTVKINKSMTPLIQAGEDLRVTLFIRNDSKAAIKNVKVSDIIPQGCNFKTNSSNKPISQNANQLIYTHTSDFMPGDTMTITYVLETSKSQHSKIFFIDSMETTEFNYDIFSLEGSGIWELTDVVARSGKKAWFVPATAQDNDQTLNTIKPFDLKSLQKPVLRFYHKYNTEHAFDGGIVRASIDGGINFVDLRNEFFRNGYNGPLSYFSMPIVDNRAFYGDSKEFIASYIDLEKYKNSPLNLQFRFGTDNETSGQGWFIDDLEIMDLVNYNSEACIQYDDNKSVCATAPEKGTIVDTKLSISTKQTPTTPLEFSLFPNPAIDRLSLTIQLPKAADLTGTIFTTDGKLIETLRLPKASNGIIRSQIDISTYPAGMYIITLQGNNYSGHQKFIVGK